MHFRLQGKLIFEKHGNVYFYSKKNVDKLRNNKSVVSN